MDYKVKATVLESGCGYYSIGDEICFNGPLVETDKDIKLCMVALNAIYPFVYAARRGGMVKETPVQCPDCCEAVKFQIERMGESD